MIVLLDMLFKDLCKLFDFGDRGSAEKEHTIENYGLNIEVERQKFFR